MSNSRILLDELSINALYKDSGVTYEVPIYQRNYAWEEDEIKTLIQDVYDVFTQKHDKIYYIGTLVTFDRGDRVFEVIDGQQRLTTIYIILKVLGQGTDCKLTYRSRKRSKETLEHLNDFDKVEDLDTAIRNGYIYANKAIEEIVNKEEEISFKNYFMNNVHILRYIVPKDVDLNHYFEVMNSRGEQLEKHEIVKAKLCGELDDVEMETFSRIWEACSQMNVYIQQTLNDTNVFGYNLDKCPHKAFDELQLPLSKETGKSSISELLAGNISSMDGNPENDRNDAFQPIIDFPNFLLIVLKITRMSEEEFVPAKFILDDKELINEFNNVKSSKEFVKKFATNLLKAKFLLDNYIVHHSNNDDSLGDNPWKLQQYFKEGYNVYPKNTSGDKEIQDELVHLLSMFEVAFTARQRKNYLFYCMLHLFKNGLDLKQYLDFLRGLADKYFFDIYLNSDNLSESNNRPKPNSFDNTILNDRTICLDIKNKSDDYISEFESIYGKGDTLSKGIQLYIFNYTDYKLWYKYATEIRGRQYKKGDEERHRFFDSLGCNDFELGVFDDFYFSRTRKSLEHYYPQAKAGDGMMLSPAQINCFGNFAMIGADANSSGSNWDPKTKLDHYRDKKQNQISVASLKFNIMMQMCYDNTEGHKREVGMEWNFNDITKHQSNMLKILFDK